MAGVFLLLIAMEAPAMKRRHYILAAALAIMVGVAALAPQKPAGKLLVLEWAAKAKGETPPNAVLIELGLTDTDPKSWSGSVAVKGAKVVHREGYRFRQKDKLDNDAWEASSHRGIKVPPRNPQISKAEKIATVGVVLHLTDIKPDAMLTLKPADKELAAAEVPLKDVIAGTPKKVWDGAGVVRLVTTATPVVTSKGENDFPAACHGPDGTLWLAYITYTLKDPERQADKMSIKEQPADFKKYNQPEFGDQLFVKYFREGKWSEPVAVTGAKEDLNRCAIAARKEKKDGSHTVHVWYSANRRANPGMFFRGIALKKSPAGVKLQVDDESGIDNLSFPISVGPAVCTNQSGSGSGFAYQFWLDGTSWSHSISADSVGGHATASDSIFSKGGDYDIEVSLDANDGERPRSVKIASSSKYEARPSIAYDPAGRLWIAYEEGQEGWGKDFGALDQERGNPLYLTRNVRVVCLQDGKLFRPTAELPTSTSKNRNPVETIVRYAYPKIGIDGKGRVWLTYRQKFGTRYSTIPGSYWLTVARRLDGDHWSEPIEVHHSDGLLDSRPVLLPHHSGGLTILHNTDGRYTTPETIHNQIFMSYIDLPGEPVEPKLVPHDPGKKDPKLVELAKAEAEAVARMRKYRMKAEGKELRLLRGEFHRHTELSSDGGGDGSLEDMYRYAIDAADLDWIGPTDHDNGQGREYSWWLTQKSCDAYFVKERFTPMFAYERSVSYPHGHRNCIFAKRGIMTLPRLAEEDPTKRVAGIHADDTKMFYRYLRELDGICASHTSATEMGTDWRDIDPKVEPIVEIYQGDRNNYEYEEAPRAGYDPKGEKKPFSLGGWKPAGYIDHAFQKGARLGFQSSSDHWSTHISFCVVLADRHDREAILDAMKKRRCYAATDNIIADVQCNGHLMGEEFKLDGAPKLKLHFVGTRPIATLSIVRDSKVIDTIKVGKGEYTGEWTDPKPEAGTHYYYVRLEQEDGELAWTSPMFIEFAK
jgi:hypothetical protein